MSRWIQNLRVGRVAEPAPLGSAFKRVMMDEIKVHMGWRGGLPANIWSTLSRQNWKRIAPAVGWDELSGRRMSSELRVRRAWVMSRPRGGREMEVRRESESFVLRL